MNCLYEVVVRGCTVTAVRVEDRMLVLWSSHRDAEDQMFMF